MSVLGVLFFHAGVPGFGGGFWGVDVFFVISGYLITRLLLEQRRAGKASLGDFYLRRARRILPALYLVLLCSACLAWFLLLPSATREFCASLAGATLFYSNVVFWQQKGYFAEINELKPLIHTWSLAVEEQFYLLWPLLLLAGIMKLAQTRRLTALWLLLLASFSVAAVLNHYRGGAAFFLLVGRLWEPLAGAVIAWMEVERGPADARRRHAGLAAMAGLVTTLVALTFGSWGKGPGTPALPAILGTCLLLRFANEGSLAARLLALRPLVLVGLCSYSIYLWHQPLFSFVRHYLIEPPDQATMYGLAAGSVVLGYLSWKWLECPCRDSSRVPTPVFLTAIAFGTTALLAFAVMGYRSAGFEAAYLKRLNEDQRGVYRSLLDSNPALQEGPCRFSSSRFDESTQKRLEECFRRLGPGYIILGDSHGDNLYRALVANSRHPFIVGLVAPSCRPPEFLEHCPQPGFVDFAQAHAEMLQAVVYTQAGFYLLRDSSGRQASRESLAEPAGEDWTPDEQAVAASEHYLGELARSKVPVLWLGAPIEPHISAHRLRKLAMRCDRHRAQVHPAVSKAYLSLDRALLQRPLAASGIRYVSHIDAMRFDDAQDLYSCSGVYWRNGDHWSTGGEQRFGMRVIEALSRIDTTASLKTDEGSSARLTPQ